MKFGERLSTLQYEPWAHFYIQYDSLKATLNQISEQDALEQEESYLSSPARIRGLLKFHRFSHDEPPGSTLFLIELNQQVEKIVLFFLQEQGRIAYQLAEYRQEQATLSAQSPPELIHGLRLKYHASGAQLLHLLQFVDLNTTGVRKILKKHDKMMHWAASGLYFGGSRRSSYMLKPLLQDTLAAVCVTLETAIAELDQQEEYARETFEAARRLGDHTFNQAPVLPRPAAMQARSKTEQQPVAAPSRQQHRRVLSHAQDFNTDKPPTDAVLAQIYAARRRLQQTSEYVDLLATTALLGRVPEEDDEDEVDSVSDAADPLNDEASRPIPGWISNQLNLMSTFLYMMNYYIVAPTSGSYASKLGSSAGLAAIIIGMTPIAALISTLLYSWWTSHSYKAALIFASCASLIGNLFYGAGLPVDSLTVVLLGRLMNGFGSARSINRRYIADSYSRSQRTAASAAFVTAGALGMAAGPAMAAMLNLATQNVDSLWWQVENAPGWFMSGAWLVYLAMLVFYFEDPPRRPVLISQPQAQVSSVSGTVGEKQPLLLANGLESKESPKIAEPPLWKNVPVMITFLVYFVLKLILECVLSASSTITHFYFGWSAGMSGLFLASLGALMLPANWCVARLARSYEDRELIMMFQVIMLIGCVTSFDFNVRRYTAAQYVAGSILLFVSTNALEGPNMSLLSKTIPKSWSSGFFNVGLLATEAGTLGRAVADIFLTVSGSQGMENMLNQTFVALTSVSLLSLLIFYRCFDHLRPMYKDE